ncbi:MAG: GNAT family N-acetyltransferase [Anaerolineae bacterium]|nr:GNAT family N-acetyltransferase [Anaerolineae bacterium]
MKAEKEVVRGKRLAVNHTFSRILAAPTGLLEMQIHEYDAVDPLAVLHLNLMCLDVALTPERVTLIRQQDPRPFPFLALYAQEGEAIAGQVGVLRLPVVSTQGAEEVGGLWAICTHPAFARRGVASRLIAEAHTQLRAAGLRYSTVSADVHRVAHALYKRLGYEDVHSSASVFTAKNALPHPVALIAERADGERLALADQVFERIAKGHLGFARRHSPFFPFLAQCGAQSVPDVWLLSGGDSAVGYAVVSASDTFLKITNLLLLDGVDPVGSVAAIAHEVDAPYVQVRVDHRTDVAVFARAGFLTEPRGGGTLMVKPLTNAATVDDFRRRYGVGTPGFLISRWDIP